MGERELNCLVIGIGPGDPELVTVKAILALNRADLVLIPRKGEEKDELAAVRREICALYLDNPKTRLVEFDLPRRSAKGVYVDTVNDWHDAIASTYAALLASELPDGGTFALLVWGDPSLYDSTLRILDRLRAAHAYDDLSIKVIPGITSVQALTAAHRIPLNALGGSVLYTTGRRLRAEGIPANIDTIVVMLDGDTTFNAVPPDGFEIYWGAALSLKEQLLISGPLAEHAADITEARLKLRARTGWVMDTYILVKKPSVPQEP